MGVDRITSLKEILRTHYGLADSKSSASLVEAIAAGLGEAAASISTILYNHRGQSYVGTQNASGDNQLDVDILCDKAVFQALEETHVFSHAISEETPVETPLCTTTAATDTTFLVTFDPLDGSSIIDANFTVGSIFGLWPSRVDKSDSQIIGRTGRDQCASAVALYGPRTTFAIALPSCSTTLNHDVVFEVTLVDNPEGESNDFRSSSSSIWILSKSVLNISPSIGKIFAPGNLRATQDHSAYASMVQYWLTYGYTLRYSGGMVPDVYHILIKEKGVFSNISSKKHKAKIRMVYEAAPMALLVECAGGTSLADDDQWTSVLDVEIRDLDQRTGLCLGGSQEVALFRRFMTENTTVAHEAAAEGHIPILYDIVERYPALIRAKDSNGWEPIHEAVRSGELQAAQLLIHQGADIHERTMFGDGESLLRISVDNHGYDHPMTEFLLNQGVVDVSLEEDE